MKVCDGCGGDFSQWADVDGKRRNLQSRRYCLTCKPFGAVRGKNAKSARHIGSRDRPYREWSEAAKEEHSARLCWLGRNRKKELVRRKGGKCQKCGYDRCSRAMTFHHRDPKLKAMSLTTREMSMRNWQLLQDEADKCDLLCFNCHMEVEEVDFTELKYSEYAKRFADLI